MTNNIQTRQGYNQQGKINLNDFSKLVPLAFKEAQFIDFIWMNLDNLDTNDKNFLNVGIRDGEDNENRIESFQSAFRSVGFDTSYWPPCVDTNGVILEGRTRCVAAKRNGEKWIPFARYSRNDTSTKNTVTNGLIGNMKLPQYSAKFNDFIVAGVHLINEGELENTDTAIDSWLYNDLNIDKVYDNSLSGAVTRIRNTIRKRASRDDSLILQRSSSECHSWINKNLKLAKQDYILINATQNNPTYAERAWRLIRKALKEGREPVDIILYTTGHSPKDVRESVKNTVEFIEELYTDSWEVVNSQLPDGVNVSAPTERPYKFLGALPQIVQDHKITGNKLVKLSEY